MSLHGLYVYLATQPNAAASWIFGGALLLFMIGIFAIIEKVTKDRLVGILAALLAAFMSYFFSGTVSMTGHNVRAAGGFAVFLAVLAYWQPQAMRRDVASRAQARRVLKRKKLPLLFVVVAGLLALQPFVSVRPTIHISTVPRYDPTGGAGTRDEIAGSISGLRCSAAHEELRVLIYAFTTAWYIQPEEKDLIPLNFDCHWSTWTHTGSRYAALLVINSPSFLPPPVLQVLPTADPNVLAVTEVAGGEFTPALH